MNERIEGVPVGTKLERIGVTNVDDFYIGHRGGIHQAHSGNDGIVVPVIIPDNVYGVIDLSTVPIPAGWERDGDTVEEWFREIDYGSDKLYIGQGKSGVFSCYNVDSAKGVSGDPRRIHVRKIKPKTRRVLVETREFTITDRPCDSLTEVTSNTSESLVKSQPHRYRIEERPL